MTTWRIVGKIKHNPEAAIVAGLALAAQVFHAQHVFFQTGHSHGLTGVFNAWLYAVAVEFAVFFFVLVGWGWVSWGFALASIGVNVAYYTIAHQAVQGWGFMFDPARLAQTWFMWLLAIVLPVAVAAFSHATDGHVTVQDDMTVQDAPGRVQGGFRSLWTRVTQNAAWRSTSQVQDSPVATVSGPVSTDTRTRVLDADAVLTMEDLDTWTRVTDTDTDTDLDTVDRSILDHLSSHGPDTKSGIASAVGMTPGAMDRTKNGKRTGRLVKLADMGLVTEGPDGWTLATGQTVRDWSGLVSIGKGHEEGEPVYVNGHGPV